MTKMFCRKKGKKKNVVDGEIPKERKKKWDEGKTK